MTGHNFFSERLKETGINSLSWSPPHQTFSTRYRSVIVFGRARILTEDAERCHALECLVEKYSPGFIEEGQREIERDWDRVCLVEVKIEHMTGKTAKELVENSPLPSA